eukprot:g37965.t1
MEYNLVMSARKAAYRVEITRLSFFCARWNIRITMMPFCGYFYAISFPESRTNIHYLCHVLVSTQCVSEGNKVSCANVTKSHRTFDHVPVCKPSHVSKLNKITVIIGSFSRSFKRRYTGTEASA